MPQRSTKSSEHGLSDVSRFVETLKTLPDHALPELRTFFDRRAELTITRAPGRLDVMGGIADYSGSLVLELPIAEATLVALQRSDDRVVRIASVTSDAASSVLSFELG